MIITQGLGSRHLITQGYGTDAVSAPVITAVSLQGGGWSTVYPKRKREQEEAKRRAKLAEQKKRQEEEELLIALGLME